ncbi:MAG: site-specific DNA-methyltransferase, partial [Acidimicrobiales bacterium]|nr:site-specific DNA-methyltransferase [Acidimicrobiales bacterium]
YTDGGEHYDGQIGSEATPAEFLAALWAVTAECKRVLKPSGSLWVNLGDKYAGGGGYSPDSPVNVKRRQAGSGTDGAFKFSNRVHDRQPAKAPRVKADVPNKSLMGLPWRYAIGCIDDLDLILRAEIVWSKPNGLPESVTDRVRRSHEQWFHFTKSPRYYSAVDEVREPQMHPHGTQAAGISIRKRSATGNGRALNNQYDAPNPLGKLPGSVWTIPSEPLSVPTFVDGQPWGTRPVWGDSDGLRRLWRYAETRHAAGQPCDVWSIDHFAAFPQEWPRRLILGWSPPGICVECGEGRRPVATSEHVPDGRGRIGRHGGARSDAALAGPPRQMDNGQRVHTITGYACACPTPDAPTRPAVVLDPFGGTGTVAMVARALGRYGVHVDLSADYLRLARWRVFDSGHAAKTTQRTTTERQTEMFGDAA